MFNSRLDLESLELTLKIIRFQIKSGIKRSVLFCPFPWTEQDKIIRLVIKILEKSWSPQSQYECDPDLF